MSKVESQEVLEKNRLRTALFRFAGAILGGLVGLIIGVATTSQVNWIFAVIGIIAGAFLGTLYGASKAKRSSP